MLTTPVNSANLTTILLTLMAVTATFKTTTSYQLINRFYKKTWISPQTMKVTLLPLTPTTMPNLSLNKITTQWISRTFHSILWINKFHKHLLNSNSTNNSCKDRMNRWENYNKMVTTLSPIVITKISVLIIRIIRTNNIKKNNVTVKITFLELLTLELETKQIWALSKVNTLKIITKTLHRSVLSNSSA